MEIEIFRPGQRPLRWAQEAVVEGGASFQRLVVPRLDPNPNPNPNRLVVPRLDFPNATLWYPHTQGA